MRRLLQLLPIVVEVKERGTQRERKKETVDMFRYIYIVCALAASICFLWLSYTGPPPPLAQQSILPQLPPSPVFLLGNTSYRSFTDEKTQRLWDVILPANNGAVLATNVSSGFHLWARPAMFHQLQCLREIRTHFIALSRSWPAAQQFMNLRSHGSAYANVSYCFDYVRQVCNPNLIPG